MPQELIEYPANPILAGHEFEILVELYQFVVEYLQKNVWRIREFLKFPIFLK